MEAARLGRESLLSSREVAERLNVQEKTLANWRCRGQGPAFIRVGGCIRYTATDVASWLAGRRVDTDGEPLSDSGGA